MDSRNEPFGLYLACSAGGRSNGSAFLSFLLLLD